MSIIYSNAILSVRAGKSLTPDRIRRMIIAPSAGAAAKILFECGYDETILTNTPEREDLIIGSETKKIFETLDELCPNPILREILLLKFDYHNATAIYNNFIKNSDATVSESLRIDGIYTHGLVGILKIAQEITSGGYTKLPTPMFAALSKLGTYDAAPFDVEIELLRAYYADIETRIKNLGSKVIEEYFKTEIDIANITNASKSKIFGRSLNNPNAVHEIFIDGGIVNDVAISSITSGDITRIRPSFAEFKISEIVPYLVRGIESRDMSAFETKANEYLVKIGKTDSDNIFSENVFFSWWVAKQAEIVTIKKIIVGKKLGLSKEELYEQLGI